MSRVPALARTSLGAALVAGIVSTLVQVVLWIGFTRDFPGILFRDARLTAALVIGPDALAPTLVSHAKVFLVATLVHFALSVAFVGPLVLVVARTRRLPATAAGAAYGIGLYAFNLHVMTLVFPWFVPARGWITLAAHVAFGVSASVASVALQPGDAHAGARGVPSR